MRILGCSYYSKDYASVIGAGLPPAHKHLEYTLRIIISVSSHTTTRASIWGKLSKPCFAWTAVATRKVDADLVTASVFVFTLHYIWGSSRMPCHVFFECLTFTTWGTSISRRAVTVASVDIAPSIDTRWLTYLYEYRMYTQCTQGA